MDDGIRSEWHVNAINHIHQRSDVDHASLPSRVVVARRPNGYKKTNLKTEIREDLYCSPKLHN